MSVEDDYSRISYETRQRVGDLLESPYVIHPVLFWAVLTVLIPIIWMIITSFKTPDGVFGASYLPSGLAIENYWIVLFRVGYWKAILNSIIITVTATALVTLLAVPAGYAFSRFRFPFDNTLFIGIIFTRLFPPIGLIIPYYQGMLALGLIDTIPGIIISMIYKWSPLMVYLARNFFISIPEEVDESALVDGCTRFQAFRKVVLPLAKPGVAAIIIMTFLYSWREFLFSFMISETLAARPISVAVYSFVGEVNVSWEQLAASSVLAMIPAILVVVFFQQYIVSGLSSGAMKG